MSETSYILTMLCESFILQQRCLAMLQVEVIKFPYELSYFNHHIIPNKDEI
jgi:hypothetical protein